MGEAVQLKILHAGKPRQRCRVGTRLRSCAVEALIPEVRFPRLTGISEVVVEKIRASQKTLRR